uniref:Uncharacterized protein n=1 Tax=Arundo donax TaxID=35708 RepID=A0A0A9BX64_ARUDO
MALPQVARRYSNTHWQTFADITLVQSSPSNILSSQPLTFLII